MIRFYLTFVLFISSPFFSFCQDYWQQEVNYTINVELDDQSHELRGDISFQYINHSPDTLNELYIHLWPNAYSNGKTALAGQLSDYWRNKLNDRSSRDRGYIDSLSFHFDGQAISHTFYNGNIDIAVIKLLNPLLPDTSIIVSTPFRVKIPSGLISRLGHIGQSYQITQWYPKPAVYDKNGWNPIPYLNQGEFYSEFGSFDVSITLPDNYVVGSTGDLQDESEIKFMNELAKRTKADLDEIIEGRDNFDGKTYSIKKSSNKFKTLHYKQDRVHDFAWFADKRYAVLKGEVELPGTRKLVDTWALFVPDNAEYWQHAIEYLNDGTYYYSKWNGNYPYSHVTAVDGTISAGGGMEYPNVTVIGNASSKEELEIVIVHEVGHNWFFGILGSNERVHGWMDEGINTLNEVRYIQTKYPGNTRLSDMVLNGRFHMNDLDYHDMGDLSYRTLAALGLDQPIETHSADFSQTNYGVVMYQKTGLVFYYLKDYLGDQEFDRIMHLYFNQWKFKHPQPEDLRSLFEKETRKNLSWFFDDLIQTTNHVDYKISSVKIRLKTGSLVKVKNKGQVDGPIEINAFNNNELVESLWLEPGENEGLLKSNITDFNRVVIDADGKIPELSRHNNTWHKKALFKKIEPLKFEFLSGDHEVDRTNIFWTPSIAGNAYDKLMLGIAFHNIGVPPSQFQYLIAPHYSFGGNRISGISEFSYSILPKTKGKMIKIGASVKSFANSTYKNSYYLGISPYMRWHLGSRNVASKVNQILTLKGIWRNDVYASGDDDWSSGVKTSYVIRGGKSGFKWSLEGLLTYYQNTDANERIFRGEVIGDFSVKYLREKDKLIQLRLYFGQNFIFESPYFFNDHMQLAMSGARGYQDLFLEEYNFERNASGGAFWAQQRNDNHGGFYSTSDFGTTRYWLSSCNIQAHIPFVPNMFQVFSNHGVFYNGNNIDFIYNSGLSINIANVIGIYFPILRSEVMGNLFKDYGREIRFTLKFNIFDKGFNLSSRI